MAKQIHWLNFNFAVGDTVAVYHKIKEANKERLQIFEGVVLAIRGREPENKSFTVRKVAAGQVGVERIWPLTCPSLHKIIVKKKGKIKRAKLYYLRRRVGKRALKVPESNHKEVKLKDGSTKTGLSGRSDGKKSPGE